MKKNLFHRIKKKETEKKDICLYQTMSFIE